MKRRWQHDRGLEARMLFTMFLLALVYLAFLAILASQGAGPTAMIAFISIFINPRTAFVGVPSAAARFSGSA